MCASSHILNSRSVRGHRGGIAIRREAGMTTIGMITLVAFIGLFVFAALRLTPVYLNYMKVAGVVQAPALEAARLHS